MDESEQPEVDAFLRSEKVQGTVQCYNCNYWGEMTGYIESDNRKVIQFVCPECKTIEQVSNVYGL